MGLWVPPGSLPRIYDCEFCGGQHDEMGLGRCARNHPDEIEAAKLKNRIPIMDENQWNPDASAYLRKVGDRMIREGRLVMKPNERIENE